MSRARSPTERQNTRTWPPAAAASRARAAAASRAAAREAARLSDVLRGTGRRLACAGHNQWNAPSSENFEPLELGHVEVDSADVWTDLDGSCSLGVFFPESQTLVSKLFD